MNRYTGRLRRFLDSGYTRVTNRLIFLSIVFFIGLNLLRRMGLDLTGLFRFSTGNFFLRPWTLLTYPLVSYDWNILGFVFSLLWLWFIGGSLERSWGEQTYALFLALATVVTGLAFALATLLTRQIAQLVGFWYILTGVTWAWAKLYPDRELLFWGIIPVRAEWLAWIQAGVTFLENLPNLFFALAAVSSIAVVYLFTGRGPFSRGFRYWAWTHNISLQNWWQGVRDRRRKRRLKVVK